MIAILKPKITLALITIALTISSCAKKELAPPTVDNNKPKQLSMQVSNVPGKPNTVNILVNGLKDGYHLNPRFQYKHVKLSESGTIIDDSSNWKEDSAESKYVYQEDKFSKQYNFYFYRQHIPASNGTNLIRALFINREHYIYRIAYQVRGGGYHQWFYTPHTKPIIVVAKTIATKETNFNIQYDHHATNSYSANEHEGTIVLKYNGSDLNSARSVLFTTRTASENARDRYSLKTDPSINITYDHINSYFIIKGLSRGINYDIKFNMLTYDWNKYEKIIKNAAAPGTKPEVVSLAIE